MSTILLDPITWDLALDSKGSLTTASPEYSRIQNVCSALKLFQGELVFNKTRGMPYWESILGQFPSSNFIRNKMEQLGLTVDGVVKVNCVLAPLPSSREVTGQVQVTLDNGKVVILI